MSDPWYPLGNGNMMMILDHGIHLAQMMSPEEITNVLDLVTTNGAVTMNITDHYGNAYVYMRKKFDRKKFGGEIKTVDLWVMQSNCVQIVVDDAGIFAGVGRLWYVYTDPTSGRQYVFSTDEVMHFKTSFSFDGITGLPVQQILRDTVAGASESQAFMNNLYESGLTAKATLEYTGELNEKAKSALVKSFEEFGSGAKNTGKILPVPLGMKLTPLDSGHVLIP